MSFEWNTFYTHFEKKMKKEYPKCKVGRYITPKQADFPYCDVALCFALCSLSQMNCLQISGRTG